MKKLLNMLYVTTENAYLSLDGENVVVECEGETLGRLPLHTLEGIMTFSYIGASPALMGKCAEMNKPLSFMKPSGLFLARVSGKTNGNILLRREQYRLCDDKERSLEIARAMIAAKIGNSDVVVARALRDHAMRLETEKFGAVSDALQSGKVAAYNAADADALRGIEGECANRYFSIFDDMILQQKEDFSYKGRSRRPPMDNINAMLSFAYSMLTSMCVSALEAVGLDSCAGFFHTERPGRCSLALDMVEELRALFADRFVLSAINKRLMSGGDFTEKENGGILMSDDGRKQFLTLWQQKKRDVIEHPFLHDKVEWGLVPFVQAMLLARYIRGDIDAYPPFIGSR